MRARTLSLGILAYSAFMLYLSGANLLRHMNVANLPLTIETNALESLVMQLTLLVLLLVGVIAKAWEG